MSTSNSAITLSLLLRGDAAMKAGIAGVGAELAHLQKNHEALTVGMSRVSQLAMMLGGEQFTMLAIQGQRLTAVFGGLSQAAAKLGALRAGLVGVAVAGVAFGVSKIVGDKEAEAKRLEAEAVAYEKLSAKMRNLSESQKLLNQRMAEGVIKPESAAEIQKWISDLQLFANSGEHGLRAVGSMDEKIAEILGGVKARDTAGLLDSHRAIAKARQDAEAETQRAIIANTQVTNQAGYDSQKLQLDGYLARRRQLSVESHGLETKIIERQEFEARARLTVSDEVTKQRAIADLERLAGQKRILAIKLEGDLSAITRDGEAERKRIREEAAENKRIADTMMRDLKQQSTGIQDTQAGSVLAENARREDLEFDISKLEASTAAKNALLEEAAWVHQLRLSEIHQMGEDKRIAIEKSNEVARATMRQAQWNGAYKMFGDMAAASKMFGKKGLAAYKAFATAQAIMDTMKGAQAAYAAMSSIPYVGPALGIAAAAAAVAAGMARVAQIRSADAGVGFKGGGYTGNMPVNQVAGSVHGQEFVINAPATKRVGIGTLEAVNAGASLAALIPKGGSNQNISVAFMRDHADYRAWAQGPGRKVIIDIISGAKREMGLA